jgi:hypothetical protein
MMLGSICQYIKKYQKMTAIEDLNIQFLPFTSWERENIFVYKGLYIKCFRLA